MIYNMVYKITGILIVVCDSKYYDIIILLAFYNSLWKWKYRVQFFKVNTVIILYLMLNIFTKRYKIF